jgi:phage FluMu protein Com
MKCYFCDIELVSVGDSSSPNHLVFNCPTCPSVNHQRLKSLACGSNLLGYNRLID